MVIFTPVAYLCSAIKEAEPYITPFRIRWLLGPRPPKRLTTKVNFWGLVAFFWVFNRERGTLSLGKPTWNHAQSLVGLKLIAIAENKTLVYDF